jgi:hypothetical protein
VVRSEADQRVADLLTRRPALRAFRQANPLALELIDIPLLAGGDLAYCDSDVLFLRPFTGLFRFPGADVGAVFMSDRQNAYSVRYSRALGCAPPCARRWGEREESGRTTGAGRHADQQQGGEEDVQEADRADRQEGRRRRRRRPGHQEGQDDLEQGGDWRYRARPMGSSRRVKSETGLRSPWSAAREIAGGVKKYESAVGTG